MALTPSSMIPLGTAAVSFELPNTFDGSLVTLESVRGIHATVVMFISNHCPYVKHVQEELVRLANDYQPKGVGFVAIGSNDIENYPDDSPEKMKQLAIDYGYSFPYLYDESQQVAKAYCAECTPDFFVYDKGLKCFYRGQLDDSRPNNGVSVTGKDIRQALDALLSGGEVSKDQKPSMGCNIKWKVPASENVGS